MGLTDHNHDEASRLTYHLKKVVLTTLCRFTDEKKIARYARMCPKMDYFWGKNLFKEQIVAILSKPCIFFVPFSMYKV